VGDSFRRDRDQNTLALSIVCIPSRTAWWAAVWFLAVYWLCYVVIVTTAALVGSGAPACLLHERQPTIISSNHGHDAWYIG